MNQTKSATARRFFLYRVVSVAAVAVAVLLRTLNLLFFYEKDIGYYEAGQLLPLLMYGFLFLSVVFFAVYPPVAFAKDSPTVVSRTRPASVAAVITAVALVWFTVGVYSAMSAEQPSPYTMPLFIAGTAAMLYCLLFALGKGFPFLYVLTGFGAIVFLGILLMESHFDVTVQMNAPAKLALQLGCISGMLLLLGELRLLCGYPKKRMYAFTLSAATIGLGTASIPSILADAFSRLPERHHALSDLVFFGLFLLALSRLIFPGKDVCPAEGLSSEEIPSAPTSTSDFTDVPDAPQEELSEDQDKETP